MPSHTVEANRDIWNNYDWSQMGEEWGPLEAGRHDVDNTTWKKNLLDQMMFRYIKPDSVIGDWPWGRKVDAISAATCKPPDNS